MGGEQCTDIAWKAWNSSNTIVWRKGPVRPWPIFNSDPLVERHHTQKYYRYRFTRRPRVNLTHIRGWFAMSRVTFDSNLCTPIVLRCFRRCTRRWNTPANRYRENSPGFSKIVFKYASKSSICYRVSYRKYIFWNFIITVARLPRVYWQSLKQV